MSKKGTENRIAIRFKPDVKAALERVAKGDDRPVSSMAHKIISDWLRANGHL